MKLLSPILSAQLKRLMDSIDELNTHHWESDQPRQNPIAYEIGQVIAHALDLTALMKEMES
jgi:hypothetical protein